MTTIKDIAESYLKKNLLQAFELPNNQKIKKLGAMKSLFGYRFFFRLALGIVSFYFVIAGVMGTSKAFAHNITFPEVSNYPVFEAIPFQLAQSERMRNTCSLNGYINIYNSEGKKIKTLEDGWQYEVYADQSQEDWEKIIHYKPSDDSEWLYVKGYKDQMYINSKEAGNTSLRSCAAPLSNTGTIPPQKKP